MPFCSYCGKQVPEDARFCNGCGKELQSSTVTNESRKEVYEGNVHKCPSCGETVTAFSTKCPLCGHEFRDAQASNAVRSFQMQLQEIESQRKNKSLVSGLADSLGINYTDKIDEQKINLIRSFSIPNTKEDILEFMILASSNINVSLYDNNNITTERKLSDAWLAKFEQAYQKAKATFYNEPEYIQIQSMFDDKMNEIKKSKKRLQRSIVIPVLGILVIFFLFILYSMLPTSFERKNEKIEKELNAIVVEIEEDIENGDYDAALIKANRLRYDENLSSRKAKQWDEQREDLIKLINEKKEEAKNGTVSE